MLDTVRQEPVILIHRLLHKAHTYLHNNHVQHHMITIGRCATFGEFYRAYVHFMWLFTFAYLLNVMYRCLSSAYTRRCIPTCTYSFIHIMILGVPPHAYIYIYSSPPLHTHVGVYLHAHTHSFTS